MLTEDLLHLFMQMLTTFSQVDKMVLSEYGLVARDNFYSNSMVSKLWIWLTNLLFRPKERNRGIVPWCAEVKLDPLLLCWQNYQHLWFATRQKSELKTDSEWLPHGHDLAQRPRTWISDMRPRSTNSILGLWWKSTSGLDPIPIQSQFYLDQSLWQKLGLCHWHEWSVCLPNWKSWPIYILRKRTWTLSSSTANLLESRWKAVSFSVSWPVHLSLEFLCTMILHKYN